jgi:hypothetical protein
MKMPDNFFTGYSGQSDDELLQVASERHSLTTEAAAALDTELRRRNLTESDRIEHQRFVKRQEQREAKRRRRRPLKPFKYQMSWRDMLWAFGTMALVSWVYIALPSRYHMKPEWQEPAFIVMVVTVIVAIATRRVLWRNSAFWTALVISSAMHLVIVHTLSQRIGSFSRGEAKGAAFLGLVLFLAVYGFVRLLQRLFKNEEALTTHIGDPHAVE